MKLDKAEKRAIAIFASLFVIFLGLTVACIIRWRVDNTQEFTTKITVEDRPANKEEKNNTKVTEFVAMEKTKSWPSEDTNGKTIIGAEYDGTVYNNSGKSIVNWSMTIYMPIGKDGRPVEGTIDSSWNGDYTNNGDSITFLPADYLERIPKDENKTFGYVLYAPNGLDFTDFEILDLRRRTGNLADLAFSLVIQQFPHEKIKTPERT